LRHRGICIAVQFGASELLPCPVFTSFHSFDLSVG